MAIISVALSFVPLYDDVTDRAGRPQTHLGNLYEMAGRPGGTPDAIGIFLLAIMVALLITATFRPPTIGLPTALALDTTLIVVMLLTKPGFGDHPPSLSYAGTADVALGVVTIATALAQIAHLTIRRVRP